MGNAALKFKPVQDSSQSIESTVVQVPIDRPWLRLYSKFLVACIATLIFFGALVTSHAAGLAVPDWPTTYGENMFLFPFSQWRGNIFYEHLHRLIASGIGFLTLVLAIWTAKVETRKWVRMLSYLALAAVIIQGTLGGITVLFLLPTAVSVSHAMLAQSFFLLAIIIAYAHSKEYQQRIPAHPAADYQLLTPALFSLGAVYLQLLLGALMRHTESGLAVLDFPEMAGSLWPTFDSAMLALINDMRFEFGLDPVTLWQVGIHIAHRAGAVIVSALILATIYNGFRLRHLTRRTGRTLVVIGILLGLQFTLGVFTVLSLKLPYLTSMHVVTGALLLGSSLYLVIRCWPIEKR